MKKNMEKLTTYLLIKHYQEEKDKASPKAIDLDKLIRNKLKIPDDVDLLSNEIQEKFNNILSKGRGKNEKFINITSWIFIILTGLMIIGSGCGLMSLDYASKFLPKINSLNPENINPFFRFIFQHLYLIVTVKFVLSLAMFAAAIGVLKRSNFARKAGVLFLIYEIIKAVVSPFLIIYIYPSIRNFNEVPKLIVDSMYGTSIALSVFFGIILIVIYAWLVYKYTSPEIKEEFS